MAYQAAIVTDRGSRLSRSLGNAVQAASRETVTTAPGSYATLNDPALIQACLQGEDPAWQVLTERYGPLVYSIPRRLGLSAADADDVFQNVFTIVFRRLGSLRNQKCLAAWLITIARRESLQFCHRNPAHVPLVEELADESSRLFEQVEQREQQLLVHQALNQLDPTGQALLSALFLEYPTSSYEEVARRLDKAVGSIGPARARWLKKLGAVLDRMQPEAFGSATVI